MLPKRYNAKCSLQASNRTLHFYACRRLHPFLLFLLLTDSLSDNILSNNR